jgi:glucokinase
VDEPILAADLGGTNTRVAVVSPNGEVMHHESRRTDHGSGHPSPLIELLRETVEGASIRHAVVGVPGRVDHGEGRVDFAPNLPPSWRDHLTQARLSEAIGLPVDLANDADLAAVGEHRFGAGRGTADMVYLTMSTGIGGGVIMGGRLVHGRRSLAEVGHITIDRTATDERRTLEGSASGTALDRLAEEASLDARGAELLDLVRAGDRTARAVWDEIVAAAGAGVASIAHVFSPELIVLGGGLGLNDDLLHDPLLAALDAWGPQGLTIPIRIARAELGDDAGLAGAAAWADAFAPSGRTQEVVP